MNLLKQKIKNGEKTIGSHIQLSDIAIGRIAGVAGFDFIWVDTEHTYMSRKELLAHIVSIKGTGTPVIVRAPQDDLTSTKKILEMGPDGIIFPMIRSVEDAKRVISYTLYPPEGIRGFGPMGAVDYGHKNIDDYIAENKDNLCRFIQIEHIDAVNCLEQLAEIPYIDGFIIGPCDLSGSIGELNRCFDENTTELIKKCISVLHSKGKYVGLSTGDVSPEILGHWSEMGIDMLSAGADNGMLVRAYNSVCQTLKQVHKGEN